jgi:hypothetical protein
MSAADMWADSAEVEWDAMRAEEKRAERRKQTAFYRRLGSDVALIRAKELSDGSWLELIQRDRKARRAR